MFWPRRVGPPRAPFGGDLEVLRFPHMALFVAGRQGINNDVLEAAKIDGANRWQTTSSVIQPLMHPIMVLSLFFSILGSLQTFAIIISLTDGGHPIQPTRQCLTSTIPESNACGWAYGSAICVTLFVICVAVMPFY